MQGYYVILIYVRVKSARISIARVMQRNQLGGHFVNSTDVVRRYQRGLLNNLFRIYMDLCHYQAILDNMKPTKIFVAEGIGSAKPNVFNDNAWKKIKATYHKYEAGL